MIKYINTKHLINCLRTQEIIILAKHVQCSIEIPSRNHCCSGKAVSITYSECVSVALGIQHTMRMRRIILSSVACPSLQYFFFHIIS